MTRRTFVSEERNQEWLREQIPRSVVTAPQIVVFVYVLLFHHFSFFFFIFLSSTSYFVRSEKNSQKKSQFFNGRTGRTYETQLVI